MQPLKQIIDESKWKQLEQYSEQLLQIIDNKDDYTRSDLQGIIDAIVYKIFNHN